MTDLLSLIKETGAYRAVEGDKKRGMLSHAYLLITADGANLDNYLKIFSKLIACKDGCACGECRACRLIDEGVYPDVYRFPKDGESITAEEVNLLIEESYIKPIEGDKKIFVLSHAENMNLAAQNKLLKTLEEPPKGVHILLGTTSEFPLLPTVKSRVKKIEIPAFTPEKLFNALKEDYPDEQKLKQAIACGDGTVGGVVSLYGDEKLSLVEDLVMDVLVNMQSSKDVLDYSIKISSNCQDISDFITVLKLTLRDLLVLTEGREGEVFNKSKISALKNVQNFCTGSIVYALEHAVEAEKRKKFNANQTMLLEWLLFKILEGKYKWRKL